ncbi:hypothetical protein E2C01_081185 [Portunus trituberculatus]|uniref:Uncharacterized protein n=1 Tax=Portunus trituberculatus TaxID=210409 RepID=A0A5B7IP56_PORTR|nr:hypothetical protein [Portunus trituberculatus]
MFILGPADHPESAQPIYQTRRSPGKISEGPPASPTPTPTAHPSDPSHKTSQQDNAPEGNTHQPVPPQCDPHHGATNKPG